MEIVTDFKGYKITADGDCSYEIKRCLPLGMKAMINLDSILKSRDITLPTKFCIVKAMVFPVVTHECESCTIKKGECCRIDAFKLWCWGRILRVPWKVRDSIPRQIDKKFRVPEEEKGVWGPQSGDRGLEFSRRRKGQIFFPLYVPSVSSVTQSCLTLRPHESQHARPPRV